MSKEEAELEEDIYQFDSELNPAPIDTLLAYDNEQETSKTDNKPQIKMDKRITNEYVPQQFHCMCDICYHAREKYNENYVLPEDADTQSDHDKRQALMEKYVNEDDRDYPYIIKRLQPHSKHTNKTLKIL